MQSEYLYTVLGFRNPEVNKYFPRHLLLSIRGKRETGWGTISCSESCLARLQTCLEVTYSWLTRCLWPRGSRGATGATSRSSTRCWEEAEQPMMDAWVLVAKNILAGFPFLQDPGGVLDNVTQILASKGALSTTSIQNRFDKCTDAAAGAWGADLSQACSVLQVSDLEMPGVRNSLCSLQGTSASFWQSRLLGFLCLTISLFR